MVGAFETKAIGAIIAAVAGKGILSKLKRVGKGASAARKGRQFKKAAKVSSGTASGNKIQQVLKKASENSGYSPKKKANILTIPGANHETIQVINDRTYLRGFRGHSNVPQERVEQLMTVGDFSNAQRHGILEPGRGSKFNTFEYYDLSVRGQLKINDLNPMAEGDPFNHLSKSELFARGHAGHGTDSGRFSVFYEARIPMDELNKELLDAALEYRGRGMQYVFDYEYELSYWWLLPKKYIYRIHAVKGM